MAKVKTGDMTGMEALTGAFYTPDEIAPILGVNPQSIRQQARQDPNALGFAVCVVGNRTLIPKEAFKFWMSHGTPRA